MLLSTQNDVLGRTFGEAESIRMLKKAGFDAFDYSMFRMVREEDYALNLPDWREYVHTLRNVADEVGIRCNQAHAPFPSSKVDPEYNEMAYQAIIRSIEVAGILGADVIIAHPMHHLPYAENKDALRDMNITFYRSLIPYCEQFNIHVAVENMWQRSEQAGNKIVDSACSRAEEFCDYIDAIGSPWIVGCLDVGHVGLVGEELRRMIHMLGHNRLRALHVHDNDFIGDQHTLPFTRNMNFELITTALHDIGYEGDFTFEADNFLKVLPPELMMDASIYMCKVGRYLMKRVIEG